MKPIKTKTWSPSSLCYPVTLWLHHLPPYLQPILAQTCAWASLLKFSAVHVPHCLRSTLSFHYLHMEEYTKSQIWPCFTPQSHLSPPLIALQVLGATCLPIWPAISPPYPASFKLSLFYLECSLPAHSSVLQNPINHGEHFQATDPHRGATRSISLVPGHIIEKSQSAIKPAWCFPAITSKPCWLFRSLLWSICIL